MCERCVETMQLIEDLIDAGWLAAQMQKETIDEDYRKMRDARRAEMRTIIDGCIDYKKKVV